MMRTKDKKKEKRQKECSEKRKGKNISQSAQMTQNGLARKPDIHENKTKQKKNGKNIKEEKCSRTLTNRTLWDKIHRILVFLGHVSC